MSSGVIIAIIVVIVVLAALAVIGLQYQRRRSLRQRFGPEYDRLVSESGSRSAAEKELRARQERHAHLDLHPLSAEAREGYATAWEQVQNRFIDAPDRAVGEADELVTRLAAERGYPTGDFDEQMAQLSVEYGHTLGHLRDAHEIHVRNEAGEATTEQLRQALVHYRALFADLLGQDPVRPAAPAASSTPAPAASSAPAAPAPAASAPATTAPAAATEPEETVAEETAADPTADPDTAYEPGRAEADAEAQDEAAADRSRR